MSLAMEDLLDGLPATLDALLEHPERHKPAVIERLLERADALRRDDPDRAPALIDAAQWLAANIPGFFPLDERFEQRAKSFEVWGSLMRDQGDDVAAEGGLLAAFELLSQTDEVAPSRMASVLGRKSLLAGDRRDPKAVFRFVEAGLEIAESVAGDQPLSTFQPLIEAVMPEEGSILPAMWVVLGLVSNLTSVPESAGAESVGRVTTEAELDDGCINVFLRREAPAWSGLPWKVSAQIRLYSQKECDLLLIRQVPSASEPGGWAVEESIGWKIYPSEGEGEGSVGD